MANRVAQQAADAAEQNAYRNYLNAVANTNIRRKEGESLDRYRQGELGVRGQDVMGMNEYRRGQIGIGETDVRNRGTYQNEMARIAGLEAMNRADAIREQSRIAEAQINAQKSIAELPFDRISAERAKILELMEKNPDAGRAFLGIKPTDLDVVKENQKIERENAYNTALMTASQQALDEYNSQVGTGYDILPNSDRSNAIKAMVQRGMTPAAAARAYAESNLAPLWGRELPPAPLNSGIITQPASPSATPSPVTLNLPTELLMQGANSNRFGSSGISGGPTNSLWQQFQSRKNTGPVQ
jgi:hypothetical protein